ncbi:MAG: cystathionine beta-lyase [Sphingomonadaceae bacterium]|uniref:cystathionine beta-lyase n=1 Tax=Thermaurantiacus sp. TaxID=2820283 RepID=UPI00298F31F1|nr:cystathionine beta-lyase [Thermaurantiacus sp.]MCS6987117.1 cystathionine beta-lyase [Sphingomonadaceae bacterium]MDW8415545.1 cystathionine beta-lyase [Thermaurantiacus sp.]
MDEKPAGPPVDTLAVEAGRRPEWTLGVVNPPVFRASTVVFPDVVALEAAKADPAGRLFYGRKGTPTSWALAEALTQLEPGAAGTVLFPSGVAALAGAILAVVRPGDHVLVPDSAYEPTLDFLMGLAAEFGIETEVYDPLAGAALAERFRPTTRLVILESPGSLSFEVQDVPAIAAAARAAGIPTLLDNSWAASVLFRGIAAGCDLVMQSLTKHVGGHADAVMGAVAARPGWFERVRRLAWMLGQCVAADEAALMLRGLRTLPLRLRRQGETGLQLARHLAAHPLVERVLHPALPGCPGHDVWARDFTGAAGVFSFVLKEGEPGDDAVLCDDMRHFRLGFSWGGYESLILPVRARRRLKPLPGPGRMYRVSVGLEDPADLVADLDQALDRLARHRQARARSQRGAKGAS